MFLKKTTGKGNFSPFFYCYLEKDIVYCIYYVVFLTNKVK